nr:uncharacterized protein LOC129380552 isoform X2 [Dermacentor andersoni]
MILLRRNMLLASCLDVRKLHEIYGTTERAIVAEDAWTAKALGSLTSTQGAVSSSQDAICAISVLGSTGETRMLNPVLLFAQQSTLIAPRTSPGTSPVGYPALGQGEGRRIDEYVATVKKGMMKQGA